MDPFDPICDIVVGHEGGFGAVSSDPGNWTGGAVGRGRLVGTKFGISAAAFPTLDIPNLRREQAVAIYRALYWDKLSCGRLPPALALLVFDAGVNTGIARAARWLQAAVGAVQDGQLGTATFAAIDRALARSDGVDALCAEFQAQRLTFMASLSTWPTFGLGWARRLCRLPWQAARLTSA